MPMTHEVQKGGEVGPIPGVEHIELDISLFLPGLTISGTWLFA